MHLLVGLGNPGKEYELTRHNFGFLLLDRIISDHNLKFDRKKFKSEVFIGEISGEKIVAIKPQTFMNLSGQAVSDAMNFYKIPSEKIFVCHDDADLSLGRIKIKLGGGDAGHNGLRSIDSSIGKNYFRLRLGIGRPLNKEFSTPDYVLGKFSREEIEVVNETNKKISHLAEHLFNKKLDLFLSRFYA